MADDSGTDPLANERAWRLATRLVRGGLDRSPHGETSEAIYLNSGFAYESAAEAEGRFSGEIPGFVYSRYANPTLAIFEKRMMLLEGAEACRPAASGMAAVFAALMCQLRAGDHVVSARAVFGSCFYIINEILPRYGIAVSFVDGTDLDQWRAAMRPNTRCVFFETPSNPTLEIIDIAGVAEIAHAAGAKVIIDNVFATPILQKPLPMGADIVVYSATKHIDGQGRTLGGAILADEKWVMDNLHMFLRHTGPALSPFNAWVLLKGLETLELRVLHQCRSAMAIAQAIEGNAKVAKVIYPGLESHPQHKLAASQMKGGFGTIISFEVKGGREAAFRMMDRLGIIDISNNLGDAKSLITHPAGTTHRSLTQEDRDRTGVTEGLLRLSVGLEDAADLTDDLIEALKA